MVVTRSRAEAYRRLAQECRATARNVSTEEGRANLLAMAQVWERLADEQDQGSDLTEAPTPQPTEQPAVQQQQQIQPKNDDKKE
jgi:hypothetical protein